MAAFGRRSAALLTASSDSPGLFPRKATTYTSSNGTIIVPAGALDAWFAARDRAYTGRVDVPIIGDSTAYGSGGLYAWCQRLRQRGVTALGLPDGGKGMFAGGEGGGLTYDYPANEVNGFVSQNLVGNPDSFDNTQGQFYYDTGATPGHQLTLQFRGSCARIWYSSRSNTGDFTYTLDGGAPVTVHAYNSVINKCTFVYLSGLNPSTVHTLVLTNLGGRASAAPSGISASQGGASSGTFNGTTSVEYVATYVFAGGETVASNVTASVQPFSGRNVGITVPEVGQSSVKIYRRTNGTGSFLHIPSADTRSGGSSTVGFYFDDAAYSNDGTTPPTTGTTNMNTSTPAAYWGLAPMFDTGVVWQKHATSGGTFATYLTTTAASASALGLSYAGSAPYSASSYSVDSSIAAPGRVTPVLAMIELGFNDLTNLVSSDPTVFTNGLNQFAAMCQAAGCPGVVLAGQMPYNAKWPSYGAAVFNAMKANALANNLIWADFFSPIGGLSLSYSGGTGNPHLSQGQYVTQADWIWDNLLGL